VNNRSLATSLVVSLLLAIIGAAYLVTSDGPQLGLDLRGGISAIYSPVIEGERPEDFDDVLDETIAVIRERVDSLGVSEPEISRQGDDVLVQLPGLTDADRAQEIIGTTAELTFRKVQGIIDPVFNADAYGQSPACNELPPLTENEGGIACGSVDESVVSGTDPAVGTKYVLGPKELGGDAVDGARAELGNGQWVVAIDFDGPGGEKFAQLTSDLACARDIGQIDQMAIVLDGIVQSSPGMNPSVGCNVGITGGSGSISVGGASQDQQIDEAQNLALVLKTGALPITLTPSTFETVSPTLGEASLQAGLTAGLFGMLLVALYLIGFYRWLGVIAIVGLLIYGIYIMAMITLLGEVGFSLTLAGIAGMIVAVGITADSSILYFERVRDEVGEGKTVRTAVVKAFESAFRTNLAGNTVTFAASVILYFLAVGPVRGFALTLGIATLLDLLILWLYTRPAVRLLGQRKLMSKSSLRVGRSAPIRASKKGVNA
jgi:preprotein translocase subunit SecD